MSRSRGWSERDASRASRRAFTHSSASALERIYYLEDATRRRYRRYLRHAITQAAATRRERLTPRRVTFERRITQATIHFLDFASRLEPTVAAFRRLLERSDISSRRRVDAMIAHERSLTLRFDGHHAAGGKMISAYARSARRSASRAAS